MPELMQNSYLCKICFQRFFSITELSKHYDSSHGDEKDFPKNGEGWRSESEIETEDAEGEEREGKVEALDVMFPVR